MALRATKPQDTNPRLKFLLFGPAGVGKTTAALQMPRPYIIDCENGTTHYTDLIDKAEGAVFSTQSIDDVVAEVRALMTEPHEFRTLVIDPFTPLYDTKLDEGEGKVGSDFGRHYGYANKTCKRLFNMLALLDMNVVVTCHQKNEYGDGMKVIGRTFDGWKKLDYLFDLVLELEKSGKKRNAVVRKTRLAEFPDQDVFEWSFDSLAERWGADRLRAKSEVIELATPAQVARVKKLIADLQLPQDTWQKWLDKAKAEDFEDMPADSIQKCIDFIANKIKEAA